MRKIYCLTLVVSLPLFAGHRFEQKSELLLQHRAASAAQQTAKTIVVDCTKGDRIQDAIDKNASPVVVEIHGMCNESVLVDAKDVTLRGTDANVDGISGGTVELRHVQNGTIENLAINASPGIGITILFQSNVTLNRCRFANNTNAALHASLGSFVNATEVTFTQNGRGIVSQRGAVLFCHGCTFTSNTTFAASAFSGGLFSLLNGTVTGRRGIAVDGSGAYGDFDCISEPSTPYPCSMSATGVAMIAAEGGEGALYGCGNFTGAVSSSYNGTAVLHGARQTATGQPGQGPARNGVDTSSVLIIEDAFEQSDAQSRLLGTNVVTFGRLVWQDDSILNGSVQCDAGGDAWFSPDITKGPSASTSGCAHGTLPP